ncbi:MAG TPA: hypothetical protein DIW44_07580 [Anaerolineaceae bacterium]|nr:hypothetical protein [Anaerolineaceae bacterium]
MLRQALLELEDDWPEYHEFVKDYPRYLQDPTHPLHSSLSVSRVTSNPNQFIEVDDENEEGAEEQSCHP